MTLRFKRFSAILTLMRIIKIIFMCFVGFALVAFWPIENFVSEVFLSFCLQYFLSAFIFLVIFCLSKQWKMAVMASLILLYAGIFLIPFFETAPVIKADRFEDITILQFNVNYRHEDVAKVVKWITEKAPDIVLIQEATPEICEQIKDLSVHYPHRISNPKMGAYGMALYSKIPMQHHEKAFIGHSTNEYTTVAFQTAEKQIPFTLVEFHACSPLGETGLGGMRRYELSRISNIMAGLPDMHKMLIGDLNTTPYSPYFKDLEKISGLRNSMEGSNFYGTWPNFLPALLRIPIDHLLVSHKIEVLERQVCPDWGSDHLPVISKLRMYAQ